jgi:uncharacterized membrane protein YedE/YeeE
MKLILIALLSGIIFGVGLDLSEMTDPQKVISFLTLDSHWDPSLAFVMAGGLCVAALAFYFIPKRTKPFFDDVFHLPTNITLDKPLILGAILFGLGWGITGYCPGPAVANLSHGFNLSEPLIVFVSIVAGLLLHKVFFERD